MLSRPHTPTFSTPIWSTGLSPHRHRYRLRQKIGLRVIAVELNHESIEKLIDEGRLTAEEALNDANVADAIVASLRSSRNDTPT